MRCRNVDLSRLQVPRSQALLRLWPGVPMSSAEAFIAENPMKRLLYRAALVAVFGVAAVSVSAQDGAAANARKTFKGYALTDLSAAGLLYDAQAKAAYYKALGPLAKEPWLAQLDGPSSENRPVKVAGADFVKIATCKNHDCADNKTVLLWAAGTPDVVYGKVYQRGKSTLIGSPPPAVAAELEKLWKAEWRGN